MGVLLIELGYDEKRIASRAVRASSTPGRTEQEARDADEDERDEKELHVVGSVVRFNTAILRPRASRVKGVVARLRTGYRPRVLPYRTKVYLCVLKKPGDGCLLAIMF